MDYEVVSKTRYYIVVGTPDPNHVKQNAWDYNGYVHGGSSPRLWTLGRAKGELRRQWKHHDDSVKAWIEYDKDRQAWKDKWLVTHGNTGYYAQNVDKYVPKKPSDFRYILVGVDFKGLLDTTLVSWPDNITIEQVLEEDRLKESKKRKRK